MVQAILLRLFLLKAKPWKSRSRLVLYVYPEGGSGIAIRNQAMIDYTGLDGNRLLLCPDAIDMLDPKSVTAFIAAAHKIASERGEKILGIVIDTLSTGIEGGDENSPKDMGRYNASCNRLEREFKSLVASVHHSGRRGKDERGHTSLKGNADVMIRITKKDSTVTVQSESREKERTRPRVPNGFCFSPSTK
jgi:RecA-family ATPase